MVRGIRREIEKWAASAAVRMCATLGIGVRTQRVAMNVEAGMRYTRITVNPAQMGGVACIRGLRIPVATVVAMVAEGMAEDEILAAYPDLEREDIREALHFAAEAVRERELPLVNLE